MSGGGGLDLERVRRPRRCDDGAASVGAGECGRDAESLLVTVVGAVEDGGGGGNGWGSSLRICRKDMSGVVEGGCNYLGEDTRGCVRRELLRLSPSLRSTSRRPRNERV